jgi:hypothetical protein
MRASNGTGGIAVIDEELDSALRANACGGQFRDLGLKCMK